MKYVITIIAVGVVAVGVAFTLRFANMPFFSNVSEYSISQTDLLASVSRVEAVQEEVVAEETEKEVVAKQPTKVTPKQPVKEVVKETPVVTHAETPVVAPPVTANPQTETPKAVLQPSTGDAIYYDAFVGGWAIAEQSKEIFTANDKSYVLNGNASLNLQLPGGWKELHVDHAAGVATAHKDGLKLSIVGDKGGEDVHLAFFNPAGARIGAVRIQDYTPARAITREYQSVFIPIRKLNAENKVVGKIVLSSEEYAHVYIDDMQFGNAGAGESAASNYVTQPEVFTDSFVNAWTKTSWASDVALTTEGARSGTAIKVIFNQAYGNIYLENTIGFNTYTKHRLTFNIKGGDLASADVSVALYGGHSGSKEKLGAISIKEYLQSTDYWSYQTVSLPLSRISAEDTVVTAILIESGAATGDIYIDDIQFAF